MDKSQFQEAYNPMRWDTTWEVKEMPTGSTEKVKNKKQQIIRLLQLNILMFWILFSLQFGH